MQQTLTQPRTDTETTPEPTRDTPKQGPRAGARPTTPKTDPWASEDDEELFTSARAPRTFDPFCTRRITTLVEPQAESPE